ncbi:MAG: response regulator, partial [Silvanigrellaceae bacterium]|nr:response regulator [Silvanigrellaceae bacterium]
ENLSHSSSAIDINSISLIICDVEMPKLDGYTFVKQLKSNEQYKHIPVILHSSLSGEANKEKARKSGAEACVTKLNRNEICDAIKKLSSS